MAKRSSKKELKVELVKRESVCLKYTVPYEDQYGDDCEHQDSLSVAIVPDEYEGGPDLVEIRLNEAAEAISFPKVVFPAFLDMLQRFYSAPTKK